VTLGTQASSGIYSFVRGVVSALNLFDLKWVRMVQAQNCIKLAIKGLS
jgi:hypothetical protein